MQVGLRGRGADLEDQLPAGAGREGEAVPARLGDGREPDRRGLGRRQDGARSAGRPISFKMDLYNPLYVDRPDRRTGTVRLAPTRHLSRRVRQRRMRPLRPADSGGSRPADGRAGPAPPQADQAAAAMARAAAAPAARPPKGDDEAWLDGATRPAEAERKRYAKRRRPRNSADRIGTGSVGNAATAAALGDFFQYAIDHPVSLARQKSAMLPIVGKDVEGTRSRIYNEAVQAKHPLLGLRFKNTTGAHLNQGPITVFEGSVYAGDTRVLDVQPNEERLLSYAIDLGTEVDPKAGTGHAEDHHREGRARASSRR